MSRLAVIDRALGDYDEDAIYTRDQKAAALCLIITQAGTHAALKPRSDRRHAVAALLTQGWQVLRRHVVGNLDLKLWGDEAIAKNHGFDAFEDVLTGHSSDITSDAFA